MVVNFIYSYYIPIQGISQASYPPFWDLTYSLVRSIIKSRIIKMEKTLYFEFKKETPGTFVYSEIVPENEESSIPTVYIKKRFFEDKRPDKLRLIVDLPVNK